VVLLLQHIHQVGRQAVPVLPDAATDKAGEKNHKRSLLNAA
jgi:hypothetical protein